MLFAPLRIKSVDSSGLLRKPVMENATDHPLSGKAKTATGSKKRVDDDIVPKEIDPLKDGTCCSMMMVTAQSWISIRHL